jgi:acyl carrier protein
MNDMAGFIAVLQDELGLPVTLADAGKDLDQVAGWDSVHLLELLVLVEQKTGRRVSLPDLLTARSMADVYAAVAAPDREPR